MSARAQYGQRTDKTAEPDVDVAVVGAGVVGAAIARELSGFEMSVALVEAHGDVGEGTSKANTAVLHTGFDAIPGSLESRLIRRGAALLAAYARRTGIAIERPGAILVAWNEEERAALPRLRDKASANGYTGCEIVDSLEVYRQVPALGAGALGGLTVPDESIICPWTATLALATDAQQRGATLLLNHRVNSISRSPHSTTLHSEGGRICARWVINAAGLGCDYIDNLFGYARFRVLPRRGELLVFDKFARPLANKIVLPVPTARGKGVLISPTVYGNVILGPTTDEVDDRSVTGTSEAGIELLLDKARTLMPRLLQEQVTASYAGVRAAIDLGTYLIDADPMQRYVLVGGVRSTGLTPSMAIAEHVRHLIEITGPALAPRSTVPEPPRMPNLGEISQRAYQDPAKIVADPAYGRIVCFCERVTAGEIRDACSSSIPPRGLDGLRRRTRAMNGRCQGFFCGAEVQALMHAQIEAGPQRSMER